MAKSASVYTSVKARVIAGSWVSREFLHSMRSVLRAEGCSQLIVRSSQSCLFVLRGFCGVWPPSCVPSSVTETGGGTIWLAWTPLSLCRLAMLLLSSSVKVVSAMLGGAADDSPPRTLLAAPFICWISSVMFSVFIISRMFAVAVGSRARTVNVQSS